MANQQQGRLAREEDLIAGLRDVSIPMSPSGVLFKETTSSLSNKICDLFARTLNIPECDHVVMIPIEDEKTRSIIDFALVVSFDITRGNQYGNIRKLSGKKQAYNMGGGKQDLRPLAGTRMTNGGYTTSDAFKKAFASLAKKDNDGNIIIRTEETDQRVAVIECDFFKVLEIALGITSDDHYNFAIADCQPINSGNGRSLDYSLLILKEIDDGVSNRRGKSGINYEFADVKYARKFNSRR